MLNIEYSKILIKVEKLPAEPEPGKGMQPFKQLSPDTSPHRGRISPSRLFTLFTADIIKQDIIFTR